MPLNEIRKHVERLLSENTLLTNDDLNLILTYWRKIDGANINIITQKPLTNPMSIIRRRQKIQAEKKHLPTDFKVRLKRGKTL